RHPRGGLDVSRVTARVGDAAQDGADRVHQEHAAGAGEPAPRVEEAGLAADADDRAHRVEKVAQHDRERHEDGRDQAELRDGTEVTQPMKAMNRPIPTLIARLRPIGTASITASRKRVRTSTVMATPSRNTTVIAWGHVRPRPATSSNATTALSPMPGARANG